MPELTGFATQPRVLRLRTRLAGASVATIGAIEKAQPRRPYRITPRALADSLDLSAMDRAALLAPGRRADAPTENAEYEVSQALQVALPVRRIQFVVRIAVEWLPLFAQQPMTSFVLGLIAGIIFFGLLVIASGAWR